METGLLAHGFFGMVLRNKKDLEITEEIRKFNHKIREKFIKVTKEKKLRKALYKDRSKD